jgi:predicted AlkP superfamily phosphohydrolase/phosphomutase
MIGLDAAEPNLIEAGIAEGWLPNLRRLREQGAYGRLASSARWLAGSPWPTFYTGTGPEQHGFYHWQQWRADKMWIYRCDPAWLPLEPFWRSWGSASPRVVAFDVPMTYAPRPFNGVEVCGWASHDRLVPPASHPADLIGRIAAEFGKLRMPVEVYERQSFEDLMEVQAELVSVTQAAGRAALALMQRHSWDLYLAVLSTTHRGGHKLWDETGLLETDLPRAAEALPRALRELYTTCDAALGPLLDEAGPDTAVVAFSLHGMGANQSRAEIVDTMLGRILASEPDLAASSVDATGRSEGGLLQRLRQRIPERYRSLVKDNLPFSWQEALTRFWRRRRYDWSNVRALAVDADLVGYVRINLKGRERRGVVEPGEPFEQLCTQIEEGFRSFVDADTGEPVVAQVARADQLFPDSPRRSELPDLLLRWNETPAAQHRALRSEAFGTVAWPCPGRHPTGRSGNHRGEGFVIARAPGVDAGGRLDGGRILDLAPTVYRLLGVDVPAHMQGRPLLP